MAQSGKPITPIKQKKRGRPEQVYRMANGQTVRVQTNRAPALMSKPMGYKKGQVQPIDAPLTFESNDFVGVIFPVPDRPNRALGYLVRSEKAAKAMKTDMKTWMEADPSRDRNQRTFFVRFGNGLPNLDYATKWSDDCLGQIELEPNVASVESTAELRVGTPPAETVGALIERHQREIANALGVAPEAVGITINLVYQDKKGDLHTTFR
jgi:hypothetical protein